MYYGKINKNDFTAAPGVSLTLFVSGCAQGCPGCHNPELWNPRAGQEFTAETMDEIIEGLTANGITRTLCLMGGDPLFKDNISGICGILATKPADIKVWLWTGYTYEHIIKYLDEPMIKYILNNIEVLVDGPYIQEERDVTLPYRGSRNQRVIDMKQTLAKGEIVLWEN
jgi:anaerobic ribonucleoside-triphosphate reductase activating protein